MIRTLAARVAALSPVGQRVLVGIAGPPGAGKSTVAAMLVAELPHAVLVPMDGFHLTDAELVARGLRDRKGAPETFDSAGYATMLRRLRDGEVLSAPDFDRVTDEPVPAAIPVTASARVIVSEGNYLLLWPEVRALFDEVWWVSVDDDVRRRRLLERHLRFGRSRDDAEAWMATVDDPNARLVAPGASSADLVVES